MLYQISRNGQLYGPYTLEDLQRYLASGNIQPTDLVKSDEMTQWIPVSQLLGGAQAAAPVWGDAAPAYPQPDPAAVVNQYPDPPNLHWGLVLLFSALTCSVFMYIWNLVVAAWVKRVQPNSTALLYYIVASVLALIQVMVGGAVGVHTALHSMHQLRPGFHVEYLGIRGVLGLAVWVVRLIARFQQRESLLEHFNGPEPIGLRLSGVMTFFFGGVYFQYHLNRINALKAAARFGTPRY
jgi:hypothetical protein